MNLSNLDYLSPSITLCYLGKRGHISNISGFLSIILSIIIIIFIAFFLSLRLKRIISSSSFYKQYENNNVNYYYFNGTELFHFFYLKTSNLTLNKYDNLNKYIRIIAYNDDIKNLNSDHWIYDLCEENTDNSLLNKTIFHNKYFFQESLCLKYYYNSKTEKYFTNKETEFKYPFIKNSLNNNEILTLNVNVEKCVNNSFNFKFNNQYNYHCASDNEVSIFLSEIKEIYLYYHNHHVLVDNYKHPHYTTLSYYKYNLEDNNILQINTIYYSLLKILTYNGFFLKNEINTFTVDYIKEKITLINNDIILKTSFQISEYSHIYKRYYYSLFKDIFPKIGGIIQLIYSIFYLINYIYYKYIYTSNAIDEIIKIENQKLSIIDIQNFFKKSNEKLNDVNNTKSQKNILKLKINEINNNNIASVHGSKRSKTSNNHHRLSKTKTPARSNKLSQSYKNIQLYSKSNKMKYDSQLKKLTKIAERNFFDCINDNSQSVLFQQAQSDKSLNCNFCSLNKKSDKVNENNNSVEIPKYINCTPKFFSVTDSQNEENSEEILKNKGALSIYKTQTTKKQRLSKFSEQYKKNGEYLSKILVNKEYQTDNKLSDLYSKINMKKNLGSNILIDKRVNPIKKKSHGDIRVFKRFKIPTLKKKNDTDSEIKYVFNLKTTDFFELIDCKELKKFKKEISIWKFFMSFNKHSSYSHMSKFTNMRNKIVSEEQMFENYINFFNIDKYFREMNKRFQSLHSSFKHI